MQVPFSPTNSGAKLHPEHVQSSSWPLSWTHRSESVWPADSHSMTCIILALQRSRYIRNLPLYIRHTFLLFFMSFFALRTIPLSFRPLPHLISFFYFFILQQDPLLGLDCQRASPSGLFPQPSVLPRTLYLRSLQLRTKTHWNVFRPRWVADRLCLLIPACHTYVRSF